MRRLSDKTQPISNQQKSTGLEQKLNRLSVKFNAKTMLEQEFGESLSDFINTANQIIGELRVELAKAQEANKPVEKKAK